MKRFLPTHKEYLCTNEVLYTDHVTLIWAGRVFVEGWQVSRISDSFKVFFWLGTCRL